MKINLSFISKEVLQQLVDPKSCNVDTAKREYIFNILLLGFMLLTLAASLVSLARELIGRAEVNHYVSTYILLIPLVTLIILYILSRIHFRDYLIYLFIILVGLLGTFSLYKYGYILPQGLLIYVLVIIMSGIMISARASILATVLIFISLSVLAIVQINYQSNAYIEEIKEPLNIENLIVYIFIFTVIFLVSWLSNREIEASLKSARESEKELLAEREMLEVKIKKRTKDLEEAQIEKSMELYRFAEFGRLSSSLLHDLANPLTVVSLNLAQLSDVRKPRVVNQVREGVTHMEQYIQSARRQLRSQSEITVIDTKYEIEKVKNFLSTKSRQHKVRLVCRLSHDARVLGDNAKFSQVIANLIANAIDSYSDSSKANNRSVVISSKVNTSQNIILILIRDKGIGITEDELEKIFNPFFTTKSSDRGTGIGLTITKRIVEEDFQGSIKVESSKNGTVFIIELPLYNTN